MSIKVMNLVWDSNLTGASRRWLLTALADRADDRGFCWPGVPNLMKKTGLSRATIFRLINEFEEASLLQRKPWYKPTGAQDTNRYRINLELLRAMRRVDADDPGEDLEELFPDFPPSHHETPDEPPSHHDTPPVARTDGGPCHGETGPGVITTPNPSVDPSVDPSGEEGPREAGVPIPTSEVTDTPAPVKAEWRKPETWLCDGHLAQFGDSPGSDRPACGKCKRVRMWAQPRYQSWKAALEAEERTGVETRYLCGMCSADGQRWDPATHVPVVPLTECDHQTSHADVLAEIASAEHAAELARHRARANATPHRAGSGGAGREAVTEILSRRKSGRSRLAHGQLPKYSPDFDRAGPPHQRSDSP